jgi:hypothetical protein
MLFLKHTSPTGKERHYDSFLAGLLGGYTIFGRTIHNSVSQQIVIYVFARVCLALAKLAVQPKNVAGTPGGTGGWELFGNGEFRRNAVRNGWPAFASLSWAMVMYLFRWHPETVQSSLRSSMSYMWVLHSTSNWTKANKDTVMWSRIAGIRYGRWYGTTNKERQTNVLEISRAIHIRGSALTSFHNGHAQLWHYRMVSASTLGQVPVSPRHLQSLSRIAEADTF